MDHKFSEIDHVTPLFKFFLVVHLQTHSDWLDPLIIIVYVCLQIFCHLKPSWACGPSVLPVFFLYLEWLDIHWSYNMSLCLRKKLESSIRTFQKCTTYSYLFKDIWLKPAKQIYLGGFKRSTLVFAKVKLSKYFVNLSPVRIYSSKVHTVDYSARLLRWKLKIEICLHLSLKICAHKGYHQTKSFLWLDLISLLCRRMLKVFHPQNFPIFGCLHFENSHK